MEIKTEYISVLKSARFVTYGNLGPRTKYFWFALHGSQMLSEQVIFKFNQFDPDLYFVVAPEAMNRFYIKGFGGDVVSSWMTNRDRHHEIADISNYLTIVYNKYVSQMPANCKKSILAFSQGGTIAFRWLHQSSIVVDNIIAYSCWIPEDIDLTQSQTNLATLQIIYTYGLQDQFFTEERIRELKKVIDYNNLNLIVEKYNGYHKISKAQLEFLFNRYIENANS